MFLNIIEIIFNNKILKKPFFLFCLITIFLSMPVHAKITTNEQIIDYKELKYKWGDSPVDSNGEFLWLQNNYKISEWSTTKLLHNPTGRNGNNFI